MIPALAGIFVSLTPSKTTATMPPRDGGAIGRLAFF
jgi:hypothetical protein